jgi:hypothetical protein
MKAAKILLLAAATLMVADFAFAQTWTQATNAPGEHWQGLVSSADGSRLIAIFSGKFCNSTNGGAAWTTNSQPVDPNVTLRSITMSADGNNIAGVVGNACWVSTDSGNTWVSNNVSGAILLASVTMSADGSKLVAVSGGPNFPGPIHISTNFGMTWMQTTAPTNKWVSVASSADGSKLVAAVNNLYATNGNFIYISTNSGTDWILSYAPTNISWGAVASSADGNKMVAGSDHANTGSGSIYGSVYTSTNSGMNWKSNNLPQAQWLGVTSSADGTKLVAVGLSPVATGLIYSSTNSGASWVSNSVPSQIWSYIASSADGGELVAASSAGNGGSGLGSIYTFQTTATPQLNLATTNGNLALSWLIPSTNFVLQQSNDLTSWATVTNAPVLNLTNLQNQVTLTPSNSSGFYRLKTP